MQNIKEKFKLKSTCVYDAILGAILHGDLKAGVKLSETGLAERLGVSRTPVREALRALDAEGFVRLSPNSRFEITSFSRQDAMEVLQIRRLLEGEASRLAAQRGTPEDCCCLQETLDAAWACVEGPAEEVDFRFMQADITFHRTIFEIAGHNRMLRVSSALGDRLARLYVSRSSDVQMYEICLQQHRNIMEAIQAHDDIRAEAYARRHIEYIMDTMLEPMEDERVL